jgi:hypothetical protein
MSLRAREKNSDASPSSTIELASGLGGGVTCAEPARTTDELLCSLDYDNLEKYCKEFLGFLLSSLLTLAELHLLDRFAMQTPQERLLAELKRRGLRADVGLNEIKAAIKLRRYHPRIRQPNRNFEQQRVAIHFWRGGTASFDSAPIYFGRT